MRDLILGIDTSNYTTSAALVSLDGSVVKDERKLLDVKQGERGLRQQEALFQHIRNMPEIIDEICDIPGVKERIAAVSVSTKPRPQDGSYMPVFMAGESFAKAFSRLLDVPLYCFSHQEGHIYAAAHRTKLENSARYIMFHLSGGTTECVLCERTENGCNYSIVGGTKDISFGQLIDRAGVAMGYGFPAGKELDRIAATGSEVGKTKTMLPKIKIIDGYINLSGIETACQRSIENHVPETEITVSLFSRIAEAITGMAEYLSDKYKTTNVLLAGGVSASRYLRSEIGKTYPGIVFGEPGLSSDNAVGTALLGREEYGLKTDKSK